MKVHIIVDFMYLYYKYKKMVEDGKIRKLTAPINLNGCTEGVEEVDYDVSKMFYPLKEIEGFRRSFEKDGNDVTVSVCFDAKASKRKESDAEYKSNRASSRLDTDDVTFIDLIKGLVANAGHNVYWMESTEADDLVTGLVNNFKNLFDFTVIYTPDTDMLVNVSDNVGVQRYKARMGYTAVGKSNYADYCEKEYGCTFHYNAILLYKCLCGDKSDKVLGIKGFGPAAFNKFMQWLESRDADWERMGDPQYIASILSSSNYFKAEQLEQALHALELVRPISVDVQEPILKSTRKQREEAYIPLRMNSLVD